MPPVPKLLTITRSERELQTLAPWLHYFYFRGLVDGMSLILGSAEFESQCSPFIHRFFREFSLTEPAVPDAAWLLAASRRAILEELPDFLVLPESEVGKELEAFARSNGIQVLRENGGQLFLAGQALPDFPSVEVVLQTPAPAARACLFSPISTIDWQEGSEPVVRARLGEAAPGSLQVGQLAQSSDPSARLRELLSAPGLRYLYEPVNRVVCPQNPVTFLYGAYDNEFSCQPASHDLKALLSTLLPPNSWHAEVLAAGSGSAIEGQTGPGFLIDLQHAAPASWLDKFPLSGKSHRVLLADSQNVAGSVLNHTTAINRYTSWKATALCAQRHPFIDYPGADCPLYLAQAEPSPELRRVLEETEVFLFFEDDDETSSAWPFDLRPYVKGKPVLHLYIGQRVHANVVQAQRPGHIILSPLPHILRMVPGAHFYAGFPPSTINEVELRSPRSEKDGILRVLHTPSLPHETTHRYYYHKDTEAFLEASQSLSRRHPKVQFWQIGGLSHDKVLQARLDCDITFNQLRGFHGLSGDEAMYLQRPMVQAFDRCNVNRHHEYWGLDVEFPWVDAHPGELAEVLESLLLDPVRRRDLGSRARPFMLEYFSPQRGIIPLVHYCERALSGI